MKFIFSPSTAPSFNLAAEEFLFSRKEDDFVFLYVNQPCVIIGSNQAAVNEVDMDFCIENDIRVFRRLSGGGAVYHDAGNLNYCFVSDKTNAPLSAHFLIPVVETLKNMHVPAETGKRKDLWLNGCKISGTASHVSKGRELHHGTLLYDSDLTKLQKALSPEKRDAVCKASASVPSPVKNIRAYLFEEGEEIFSADTFFELFTQQMMAYFAVNELSCFSNDDLLQIETLKTEKYTRREWNYRM